MANHSDDDRLATGAGLELFGSIPDKQFVDRRLGDYRITGLIAEGGMGRVYRAERIDGNFEREVAIKISATSGLSETMRSRFAIEQGVLAGLNHPNIAQLYDAQVTEEGWPYLVMELVDGQPIDDYVRAERVSLENRVRMLADVVDAIAYAHSRLVVHRDIKPSNVMVGADGRPKLLDFGIAKLLEADAAALTRGSPMTPRYASPEQLLGQPITIASDVYQLGLLLFEVLTGKAPNPDETLTDAIQRAASGRSVALGAAALSLPRELLLIIEQCLRPVPDERYPDANALRRDLEAWLTGYPVSAAGQSAGYRLRKLLARNKPTAATAITAILAVVAGAAWYTWQLSQARANAEAQAAAAAQEAEKASQIANFLIGLLETPNPDKSRGADVTVREVLDAGVEKVRNDFEGPVELKADLLYTMAQSYNEIGEFETAGQLIGESVELHRASGATDPAPLALAIYEQSRFYRYRGDLRRSRQLLEEALSIAEDSSSDKGRQVKVSVLNSLGIITSELNDFAASESYYKRAIDLRAELNGPRSLEASTPMANYARLLTKLGRDDEALPLLLFAYEIAENELGPVHGFIPPRAINLGRLYQRRGNLQEAERLLRRALEVDRALYGDEHHHVASSMQNLALLVAEQGDIEAAASILEEALAIELKSLGETHVNTGQTRTDLAKLYVELGRYGEAERLLAEADTVLNNSLDGDHIYLADLASQHGSLLLATDRPADALGWLGSSISMYERLFGTSSTRLAEPLTRLAEAYESLQRYDEAAEAYGRTVVLLDGTDAGAAEIAKRHERHADLLSLAGRGDDAQAARARAAATGAAGQNQDRAGL